MVKHQDTRTAIFPRKTTGGWKKRAAKLLTVVIVQAIKFHELKLSTDADLHTVFGTTWELQYFCGQTRKLVTVSAEF